MAVSDEKISNSENPVSSSELRETCLLGSDGDDGPVLVKEEDGAYQFLHDQ